MRTQRSGILLVVASLALAAPAAAQHEAHHGAAMPTSGLRAELIKDIDGLEKKYVALAGAMKGKYGWRPGAGVRSVGQVYAHIAGAGFFLPIFWGVKAPEGMNVTDMNSAMAMMGELEKLTDEEKIIEHVKHSMMHARHAIAQVQDDKLDSPIKLFGQDATVRAALVLMVSHMHEHLGQAIAYARMNGVVPPWSSGGI